MQQRFLRPSLFSLFAIISPRSATALSVLQAAKFRRPTFTIKMASNQGPWEPMDTEEREGPVWDPVAQIYVGGVIPHFAEVDRMIEENQGTLRLFGYGSLCWNPGTGALAHPSVKHALGRARGYRRCWAQKSTDHRGNPSFPGLVCTLIKDEEYREIRKTETSEETLTEGLLYEVPPELVKECLAELDFREKGGYARDIIDVIEDESGKTVKALLYRGTPDNPAFWPRALRDLPLAAATMAVATGPSGPNEVYLHQLDEFLESAADPGSLEKFDDTFKLADMAKVFQEKCNLHFLFGSGSNQHNQLLLHSEDNAANLVNGEDSHDMKEIILCTEKNDELDPAVNIFAGGGHSGLLTKSGRLYLWGWNHSGQLGTSCIHESGAPLPVVAELRGIRVETCALGFNHTVVIEKGTGRLYAFGENSRSQVGVPSAAKVDTPVTPEVLEGDYFVDVAAGLFHSAAITKSGELVTFGCGRFGQSLSSSSNEERSFGRWKPDGGSCLVRVACGRRHTVALDDHGRIWTFGDNKYGQLGRSTVDRQRDPMPALVQGEWMNGGSKCIDIECGWSHTVVMVRNSDNSTSVFGWGRNDRGQLGTGSTNNALAPIRLFGSHSVKVIACGSECSVVVDGLDQIWSSGWNEHGNLATGDTADSPVLVKVTGSPVTTTPRYPEDTRLWIAAGGAHLLAMRVALSPKSSN